MRRIISLREFTQRQLPWNGNPEIGWWLDNDPVTFYHGTHKRNLENILETGIYAPKEGSTAGWISLALDPNTAFGYASMSGTGGETAFRAAGAKAVHTPSEDRVIFVIQLHHSEFKDQMANARGNMDNERNKLISRERYDAWDGQDQEYYALTEIRMPDHIDAKHIKGYMFKGQK